MNPIHLYKTNIPPCPRLVFLSLFMTLIFSIPGVSQISITQNGILGAIGTSQSVEIDSTGNVMADLGNPGADQEWDFRSLNLNVTLVTDFEFFAPVNTPFMATFPTSNLCEKVTFPSLPGFELFNYYMVSGTQYVDLGDVLIFNVPILDTLVTTRNDTISPLPVNYNDSWVSITSDTLGSFPAAANIILDSTWVTVDAYGNVRLPDQDYECLRIRQDNKTITNTVVGGTIAMTTEESTIGYIWITENNVVVASAFSGVGVTDPDFDPVVFSRLISNTTSINDVVLEKKKVNLLQNVPNPFSELTEIEFFIAEPSYVRLDIYDYQGKLISTLVNEHLNSGWHKEKLDLHNLSGYPLISGVYYYSLTQNSVTITKKMIVVR